MGRFFYKIWDNPPVKDYPTAHAEQKQHHSLVAPVRKSANDKTPVLILNKNSKKCKCSFDNIFRFLTEILKIRLSF